MIPFIVAMVAWIVAYYFGVWYERRSWLKSYEENSLKAVGERLYKVKTVHTDNEKIYDQWRMKNTEALCL